MLNIQDVGQLAALLRTKVPTLRRIANTASLFCEELILLDPARPDKRRAVLNVFGPLRTLQNHLYREVLAPAHRPSICSHGGVRGRNIKSNVAPHLKSSFVYTTDIANFYPSIHYSRIYRLFVEQFACSADVSRICTMLCTYRYHMPLGLITSPILADCLMRRADHRIVRLCETQGLIYTRYVDDITLSGPYPIESGSARSLVRKILEESGFQINQTKEEGGRLSDEKSITKLRIKRGRLDVTREYLAELEAQLDSSAMIARGSDSSRPYYTRNQIYGRIQYVAWINRGRRPGLMSRYRSIDWDAVEAHAAARGLAVGRKKLIQRTADVQ